MGSERDEGEERKEEGRRKTRLGALARVCFFFLLQLLFLFILLLDIEKRVGIGEKKQFLSEIFM